MKLSITCFLPFSDKEATTINLLQLQQSDLVAQIYVLGDMPNIWGKKVTVLPIDKLFSSKTMEILAQHTHTPYLLFYTQPTPLQLGHFALQRFCDVAKSTQKGFIYGNSAVQKEGKIENYPVIDYQEGSLRDDFDFGALIFMESATFKQAQQQIKHHYDYAGWYAIRLEMIKLKGFFRIPETLYTNQELDCRKSGEKLFDYVNPKNREVQIEMEHACTQYLKNIGALLPPVHKEIDFSENNFSTVASVIIPVRNREKTIADAIKSVLNQQTDFSFNLIVVDNHSTDRTTAIIQSFAKENKRIIHLVPNRTDLGIGGCWNEGIFHRECGQFAVQLDSDDLYADNSTLQQIIATFYAEKCAMVIGSYQMVDFDLQEIPPGIIDHKEWTPENGHNNALRINGLGAPRAFYTPILRENPLPNVSYGEDYAIGLKLSRSYKIGRIYNPIYLCRRWHDNSDAALDIEKMNAHNFYKDTLRTIELQARLKNTD